jgi:hypothetical protein
MEVLGMNSAAANLRFLTLAASAAVRLALCDSTLISRMPSGIIYSINHSINVRGIYD